MELFSIHKVVSEKTYKSKDGKEKHYENYFLENADGRRIAILPNYNLKNQKLLLDVFAVVDETPKNNK